MADENGGLNRDTLVGILGAAVLVAAMAGVFAYERGQFRTYSVDWQMQQAGSTGSISGDTLQEGDSADHDVAIAAGDLPTDRSLAQVRATVTWSDDVGDPDEFSIEATGPGDLSHSTGPDDGGNLTVTVHAVDQPNVTKATARSPEDARTQAAGQTASDLGLGNWTITVTLDSAPGDPGDPAGVTATEDGSNDYSLRIVWDVWEPRVTG